MSDHPRLTYRPELDGIRGVAVLLVLIGHTHMVGTPMPSVVGVTLFFVLSGYLITGVLGQELASTGRVMLRRFYARRVRRLLPALIAMLAVTAGYLAVTGQLTTYGQAVASALFYSANLALVAGAPMGMLAHTWSLSLEEQFYLVWPLLLAGLGLRRRTLAVVLGGIVLATLLRLIVGDPASSLYRPDVRMDALLWGVLLALWPVAPGRLAWLGWLAIAGVSLITWTAESAMLLTPLVAIASVAVIASARPGLLSNRWLVRVGEISYGLYLWHYAPAAILDPLTAQGNVLAIAAVWIIAFALALVSERWIERRWRRPRAALRIAVHEAPIQVSQAGV